MCFILTCGEQEFSKYLQGYENVTAQCHNCGNYAAHVLSRWNFFTLCFIPIIPLSTHRYHDVVCNICHFAQPLENRQDVMAMANNPGTGQELQPQAQAGGGPPPGWGGGAPPGQQGQPGQKVDQGMVYR